MVVLVLHHREYLKQQYLDFNMKKVFKYIENLWIGNDGKPSIRRLLAIIFSVDLLNTFHKLAEAASKLIGILSTDKQLDSAAIGAISSFIANEAMIIGIEAGFIAALLSLTTYQSLQLNKPSDSNPYSNPYVNTQTDGGIPKVPPGSAE